MDFQEYKTKLENLLTNKFNNDYKKFIYSFSANRTEKNNIINLTEFLNVYSKAQLTISFRIKCILNNISNLNDIPKCSRCGKIVSIDRDKAEFREYCSNRSCYQSNPETNKKRQETAIKNHGSLKAAYQETSLKTIKEKYGDHIENASQISGVNEKKQETSLKNYGETHHFKNKEKFEEMKQHNLEKYGVENISQIDSVKEEKERISIEKYGVKNIFQAEIVKEKIVKYWQENFGVDNPSQLDDIQQKKLDGFKYLKKYIMPDGTEVSTVGFENIVLDFLINEGKLDYKTIEVYPEKEKYIDENGIERVWFPDLKINKTLIDVKSTYILRLNNPNKFRSLQSCGKPICYLIVEKDEIYRLQLKEGENEVYHLQLLKGKNQYRKDIMEIFMERGYKLYIDNLN